MFKKLNNRFGLSFSFYCNTLGCGGSFHFPVDDIIGNTSAGQNQNRKGCHCDLRDAEHSLTRVTLSFCFPAPTLEPRCSNQKQTLKPAHLLDLLVGYLPTGNYTLSTCPVLGPITAGKKSRIRPIEGADHCFLASFLSFSFVGLCGGAIWENNSVGQRPSRSNPLGRDCLN